ncbi:MAG: phosphate uptake regulator PhoU [Methanomassiliicoccales archaeon]|nr:phosphate uptake regulator PhoU [Candidatus Methanomethylophilaceae archaeon]MCI6025662.1 phosphate uptake regulator PhoU [Methanomassiliicoccales archaeon]MDD7478520.1 phosphate uptake regulator PhoU [Methanomassiliicoccales archaeon]MDY4580693.1 phosphate uptake regulator PhoU [Candidatus Methanarcanum hacksteinii]
MEIRKVQITGGSSMMITLPKEWAETVGLKKNDPVSLDVQNDGSLIIFPNGMEERNLSSTKCIDVNDISDNDFLYRQLVGAYIAGHNMIELRSNDKLASEHIDVVSSFVQTSIGLEIIEENDNSIIIQDLMNQSQIRPLKSLERMEVLVRNMLNDVIDSIEKKDVTLFESMVERDKEVDRIHWLILRQVSINQRDPTVARKQGMSIASVTRCSSISRIIERIGDHAVLMSKNMRYLLGECPPNMMESSMVAAGRDAIKLFSDSIKTWKTKDMVSANACIERGKILANKVFENSNRVNEFTGKAAISTGLIIESVKRIIEYSMDISEIAINATME